MSYKLQLVIGDTRTPDGANRKVKQLLEILNKHLASIRDNDIYIDFCEARRGDKFYQAARRAGVRFPVLNDFAMSKRVTGENEIIQYVEQLCQCGGPQRVDGGGGGEFDSPESTFEEMYENAPEDLQASAYKDYMSSTMIGEGGVSWRETALMKAQNRRARNKDGKNSGRDAVQQSFMIGDHEEEDAFSGYTKDEADKKMRKFMSRRRRYGLSGGADMGGADDDDDEDDFAAPVRRPPSNRRRKPSSSSGKSRNPIRRVGGGPSSRMQVAPENEEERLFGDYWKSREETQF